MAQYFDIKLQYDINEILEKRGLEARGRVQQYIDTKVLEFCKPLVPKDNGDLIESGIINTQIGSGLVRYRTPYARRWYYMPAYFQEAPERGNYWFERMKVRHLNDILNGAKREASK